MNSRIEVHGHRGSRGTHPENTLPAFEEGAAAGADFLELDLHMSSDDIPMVFHDPVISGKLCRDTSERPVQEPFLLRELTARQLTAFECGATRNPAFPDQVLLPGTRIPTLEQVLRWQKACAPETSLNIEIKVECPVAELIPDPVLFVDAVLRLVKQYGAIGKVMVQSFDLRIVSEALRREPGLRTACLFENPCDFAEITEKIGSRIAAPHFPLVTPSNVKLSHDRGIAVIPWTVNKPGDWDHVIAAGVDGIITDYPRRLIARLSTPA